MEAVFITTNNAMELVAMYEPSFFNALMVLSPNGVAALPIPKKLAEIFIAAASIASLLFFSSGKIQKRMGLIFAVMDLIMPAFSAILIMPDQSPIIPIMPIESSTALLAPSVTALLTKPIRPVNAAITTDAIIIKNQILFNMIILSPFL